jgi:hypothetical protein
MARPFPLAVPKSAPPSGCPRSTDVNGKRRQVSPIRHAAHLLNIWLNTQQTS